MTASWPCNKKSKQGQKDPELQAQEDMSTFFFSSVHCSIKQAEIAVFSLNNDEQSFNMSTDRNGSNLFYRSSNNCIGFLGNRGLCYIGPPARANV